jgi:protocatechuate 3,4-dioxygenase beta subunit
MAAQTQPAGESLCSVAGKVVNEATGEPLKDATLTLRLAQGAVPAIFTTATDDAGRFAFAGIEPGQYAFRAERMGFLATDYGARRPLATGTPLVLSLAQNITGVEFRLKPQGVIAGRVLDADGDPVRNASVALKRARYVNGKRQLNSIDAREMANVRGNFEVTNDQGQYRFFGLAPGRYYVSAGPGISGLSGIEGPSRDSSAKPQRATYVVTFHPSTVDARRAEPVEVSAGKVVSGADVTLATAPTARISGYVVNFADSAGGGPSIVQIYRADGLFVGEARLGARGEFDIDGKGAQGKAWFVARLPGNSGWSPSRQPLLLTGGPMEGVSVTLSAGIPLGGKVRLEDGGAVRVNLAAVRISLALPDLELARPMPEAAVSNDGSFTMTKTGPDRYLPSVSGLPSGVYVKSMRMGEEDVLENGLNLTQGTENPLEIVLSDKTGSVAGSVRDDQDTPAAAVTVALVPQSAKRRERAEWYRTATTDPQGRFTMTGAPPGEYRLFAWEDVEDGAWMDAEFFKPIESKGKPVTVREGGSETVELKLIQ